ncbi:MAG: hypothetical protein ACP5OA_01700 [Candidatus Woesearchaeota archaeon]
MDKQLAEWTVNYVKNRDLTFRKLIKYTEKNKDEYIEFEFKDKTVPHLIIDKLSERIFEEIKKYEHKVVVCLNTEENFKFLIKNWKKLADTKNLSFLFVNIKLNDKWVINPHTHSMIADPDSIESGLRTMYDTANGKVAEVKAGKKKASMFEEGSSEEDDEGMGEE